MLFSNCNFYALRFFNKYVPIQSRKTKTI
ncbi:rCG22238 [Rattus norvegicus]|uniref:RCG22238 n=1 Tax=Rattus norvegicus TaxID=10116 RepID=A6INU5_RAT|nr:rCG22238 [Rattus norvegicus]